MWQYGFQPFWGPLACFTPRGTAVAMISISNASFWVGGGGYG